MPDTKLEENIISEQVKRLQKVLTFRTISKLVKEEEVENGLACFDDPNPLHELHKYIREQFPEIFSTPERVSVELINEGSFLIHVKKNSNKSEKLDRNVNEQNETVEQNGEIETEQNGEIESEQKESDSANLDSGPFLLIAHMDVVPTVDKEWKHPPFEGIIEDGYLYGRGALDDKGALMAMLEATSSLIRDENFVCKRDFYIALTHDEEVKGNLGAKNVAPKLEKVLEGKKLDFILDEGLVVFEDFRPGFPPIAFVAICEKGHLDLKITVKTPAGHSSLPQASTAVTKMCEIVTKLNKFSFPIYLKGTPMHGSLNVLSPFFSAAQRTLINSIGMSDTIMKKIISSDRLSATLMQTTKVVTKIEGGTSGNVIPSECSANVNFRLHPNDTCDRVMETVKKLVGSNEVTIEKMDSRDPPKCSSTDSVAYDRIVKAVGETFKECEVKPVVAPNLLTGQTDSRHFQHLTIDTYRFTPYYMKRADIQSIHGHNERIGIDNYHQVIEFFTRFIRETAFETRKEVSNQ